MSATFVRAGESVSRLELSGEPARRSSEFAIAAEAFMNNAGHVVDGSCSLLW